MDRFLHGRRTVLFPKEVNIHLADLNELSDDRLRPLLSAQTAVVFAAGKDDREVPKAPAYDFFRKANVDSCRRLFSLSRECGVKRGLIIGSYFAHFDRLWPQKELSRYHPYIRARREQAEESFRVSLPDLDLMVIELPYVFGASPGRVPLWEPFVDYVSSPLPLLYPKGSTNMIAVERAAEAIVEINRKRS